MKKKKSENEEQLTINKMYLLIFHRDNDKI